MHIAIIGAGNVGATLGRRFTEAGHTVSFGVRDPSGDKAVSAAEAAGASAHTVAEAIDGADVVLVAVPAVSVPDVAAALQGTSADTVIDATNVVGPTSSLPFSSSATYLADHLPSASVAKAFNTVGFEVMADPVFGDRRAVLFIAGDERARTVAATLGSEIGFDVVALGGRESIPLVEAQAITWIRMMSSGAGRRFAFARISR
jgi:predicted dinucleotide-binding enzyme